jgi:hypothetical protein
MWILSHLVLMCYAHGYGKSGNCPTLKYIVLCHYTWRWLSSSDSKVWMKRLCLLQETTLTTLDVTMGCVILCVQKVLPSTVLLLEGRDGQTGKDRVCNCVPCHFLIVDGQMDPSLVVVLASLWCMLCAQVSRAGTMLICDKCFWSWHMGCLMPPLEEVWVGKWFCPWCTR